MNRIYSSILDDDLSIENTINEKLPICGTFLRNFKISTREGLTIQQDKRNFNDKSRADNWYIYYENKAVVQLSATKSETGNYYDNIRIYGYRIHIRKVHQGDKTICKKQKSWESKGVVHTEKEMTDYFNKYHIVI